MKLEGSLQNRMMEGSTTNKEIVVGMGATELLYTDRNPYTVIEVKAKTEFWFKRMEQSIKLLFQIKSGNIAEILKVKYWS